MAYIYLLELIVDDVSIFSKQPSDDGPEQEQSTRAELCVRLQLGDLVRCEVCEKDFGSTLDLEPRKAGENCLFVYRRHPAPEELAAPEPMLRLSVHQKAAAAEAAGGKKELVGFWEGSGRKFVEDLARAYDEQNGALRSAERSRESLHSSSSSQRSIQPRSKPVSHTWKAMHPLKAAEGTPGTVGFVVVTMRVSCLGPNASQKVLLGGRRDLPEQPVTCYRTEDDPAVVKCFAMETPDDGRPGAPRGSLASVGKCAAEMQEDQPYDEYAAELNGNAICIRVERDVHIAVNVDGEEEAAGGCTKGCWTSLTLPDGVYGLKEEFVRRQANACKLPVVRGTLKYPAHHWTGDFMIAKRTTPVTIDDFRKRPDPTRTVGLQAADEQLEKQLAGIEICRKGWHDPNVDVFVLRLGKPRDGAAGAPGTPRHRIEIELRTPKGPTREIRPKETRGVQVLENEFECETAPAAARPTPPPASGAPDGEAKGKKPAKPAAGKKGKKK